jgi:hypothetical protein
MDDELLVAWDSLNGAIQRMLVSQPWQMTAASEHLEDCRKKFFDTVLRVGTKMRSQKP